MCRKYYLRDICVGENYNAGTKAVIDVNAILETKAYSALPVCLSNNTHKSKWWRLIMSLYSMLKMLFTLKKGDIVFVQYPYYIHRAFIAAYYRILYWKQVKIQLLIHDLNSLRNENGQKENDILTRAEMVVCHTPRMKDILQSLGVQEAKIKILYLFDYITDVSNNYKSSYENRVVFAGNMSKSRFLTELPKVHNVDFLLYGLPAIQDEIGENVHYIGKFAANDIADIKGDWGLVWDGNNLETCTGLMGKYLAVNSSHKISLYIASEKPVIVWDESSLKDFITNNHLGISVKSVHEIADKIASISDEDKNIMTDSLKYFSQKLKNGEMLGDIIAALENHTIQ